MFEGNIVTWLAGKRHIVKNFLLALASVCPVPCCAQCPHVQAPTKEGHSPSCSMRITDKSFATAVTDLQHTLKGMAQIRKEALSALGKLAEQACKWTFSEEVFYEPRFSHLPTLRPPLKPLTKIPVPCD